ncbi:raffinose synthase Sip1-like protein [Mariniflexile fucanivorans]|uniref:Raffinose synthase Sip1-like protein n=1 Tax=Mariniflexile fucanivorans TaxID=264023 RepID=A0A4V2QE57_9FLAO|nr:Sip1-related alpha-galactosidase [Mariniflexile fucanivorans]TCL66817.1 raffinose synthase Sip1-like protein [Mariniflexile fucanivorans]
MKFFHQNRMNNLQHNISFFLVLFSLIVCGQNTSKKEVQVFDNIPKSIVLEGLTTKGILSLNKQQLIPNQDGIIAEIKLELLKFKKGIYYRPFSSKLAAGNRVEPLWFNTISDLDSYKLQPPRMDDFMNLGAFMMLQKVNGDYLALLPLVSNRIGNTFSISENNMYLTMATYGTQTENVSVPFLSYAQSKDPYEAARQVWELAMEMDEIKENINWREQKEYPEAYKYLGWCSWEHYKQNINEKIIVDAIQEIKESPIPFRWVLVDDGYLDHKNGQLLSFGVDKKKFPNGWNPITSQKDDKIKWMGIWRNFNGYMQGVSPEHTMSNLEEYLEIQTKYDGKKRLMPQISEEAANAFYNEMTTNTKENGFNMIKVDFQSDNFRYNTGASNAILGVHYNNTALEENCKDKDLQLLNCIAQQNFNVFNHKYSALIRGSVDYKTTKDRLDITLVQNFANAFWLGHTHWLDQDMFYSNYKETAQLMAVARAMSGGPIYLSDEPKNIDNTVLKPLIYADGRILGTLAPAVPLPESLMQDPYFEGKAFRVIAPLENNTAAIMAVNLKQNDEVVTTHISLKDYPFAGGMIQPYKGLWELPKQGVLLYDHYAGSAQVLKEDYQFTLASRKERLFLLSPIKEGWSVIGRPDKYMSASAYKLLEFNSKMVKIKMVEDGPILLWSDGKIPTSENIKFKKLENGLWHGKLIKSNTNKEYIITGKRD